MRKLRIGTRTSKLAMAQSRLVKDALQNAYPGTEAELVPVVTKGDQLLDRPLDSFGGKGVFTRELEEQLLAGTIDLAVHSAKDVPMELPEGLSVCSVLTRGNPWDVLITRKDSRTERASADRAANAVSGAGSGLCVRLPAGSGLLAGGVIGTSSLRRELQILEGNPQLGTRLLRGNVLTRLERLREGRYDAIILAGAGLERLGLYKPEGLCVLPLDDGSFLPAAGQGILAVEYRTGELEEIWKGLCQPETEAAFQAERRFLKNLGGSCNAPCAAYFRREGQSLVMSAMYAPDKRHMIRVEERTELAAELFCEADRLYLAAGSLAERVTEAVRRKAGPADKLQEPDPGKDPGKSAGNTVQVSAVLAPRVSLVGAGPGEAGLVTCKGLACIRRADVIIYDNLISASLLNEARLDARLVYAGKRSGAHHMAQAEISRLLVEEALAGNYVVRLKGGDPLVFGRGSEEALKLEQHGITYEIVPGVSSSYSVPAYAGIPVTERGVASSFHVITGHEGAGKARQALDYTVLAREEGTLVFLMGLGNLARIVAGLLAGGRAGSTPVAVIQQGATARQKKVVSDLEHIVAAAEASGILPPAVVVVGEAAGKEHSLDWYGRGPLAGTRILLTGTRGLVRRQIQVLAPLGAETVAMSLVECRPVRTQEQRQALLELERYQWVVLTSANGVECFFTLLRELDIDHRSLAHLKFAVAGSRTGDALKDHGFRADVIPSGYTSRELADIWIPMLSADTPVLLLRAREGSMLLPERLGKAGIPFRDIPLYETWRDTRRKEDLERMIPESDFITIASASAARALAEMAGAGILEAARIISIGPETTRAAARAGLTVAATAKEATAEGLRDSILSYRLH